MKKFMEKNLLIILSGLIILLLIIILLFILNNKTTIIIEEKMQVIDENIVFFGDSITDYYDLKKYYDNYVVNSGISGDLTNDLLNRMDDVYKYNPSKVILLIGINDLRNGKDVGETADNIKTIIEKIKENRKNAEIYVQSVYPINRDMMGEEVSKFGASATNDKIKELNKKIKQICKEQDVEYINMYDKLIDEKGNLKEEYSVEGLHVSDEGYEYITTILKKYINSK